MEKYRLYQDGEINFTLQAPDNHTVAVFAAHQSEEGKNLFRVSRTDLRKPNCIQKTLDTIHGKERAVEIAYLEAKKFASKLDPDFEDHTEIGELEEGVDD